MKTLRKSILIAFSPAQMFAVVSDVAAYPEFLPGCKSGEVLSHSDWGVTARVGLSVAGFQAAYTTRNEHVQTPQGGYEIGLQLIDGPFSHLQGRWTFAPIVGSHPVSSSVQLELSYELKNKWLGLAMGTAFEKLTLQLIDAFVARAKQKYAVDTKTQ